MIINVFLAYQQPFVSKLNPKGQLQTTHANNSARSMVDVNRDGYRDQIVSMSIWTLATEYVMWGCFLHSTTCMYVPFIVHKGIKWHMNTTVCSQCPILFPHFFYNPYISLLIQRIFHSLVSALFLLAFSMYMYILYMYIQRDCVFTLLCRKDQHHMWHVHFVYIVT